MSSHRDGALSTTWVFRKCGMARCPRCERWFVPAFHYAETWCPECAPEAERDLGVRTSARARAEEQEPAD